MLLVRYSLLRCSRALSSCVPLLTLSHLYYLRCPRFTLHHVKSQTSDKLGIRAGPKSFRTAVQPITSPYHLVRPHSSSPRLIAHASDPRAIFHESVPRGSPRTSTPRLVSDTSLPFEKGDKPHARSKSAHGRTLTTPCHTNAGKKQLEVRTLISKYTRSIFTRAYAFKAL